MLAGSAPAVSVRRTGSGGINADDNDRVAAFAALDVLHARIIHGDARGADRLCRSRGIPHEPIGKATVKPLVLSVTARPDYCVAFPGGLGTAVWCVKLRRTD